MYRCSPEYVRANELVWLIVQLKDQWGVPAIRQRGLSSAGMYIQGRERPIKRRHVYTRRTASAGERSIKRRHVYTRRTASIDYVQAEESGELSVELHLDDAIVLLLLLQQVDQPTGIELKLLLRERLQGVCNQREIYQSPACIYRETKQTIYTYRAYLQSRRASPRRRQASRPRDRACVVQQPGRRACHQVVAVACRQGVAARPVEAADPAVSVARPAAAVAALPVVAAVGAARPLAVAAAGPLAVAAAPPPSAP